MTGGVALHVNPIGLAIAVAFLLALIRVFAWMFHAPKAVPEQVATIRRSVNRLRRIIVPVTSSAASAHAVELAARMALPHKATLILVSVIEVPYSLPLDAYSREERRRVESVVQACAEVAAQYELPVETRVVPGRSAWDSILRTCRDEHGDMIVMGVFGRARRDLGGTVAHVLQRAEVEVIVDQVPVGYLAVRELRPETAESRQA